MGNESSNGAEEPTVWVYHSAVVSAGISRMLANWLKGPFQIQKCPPFQDASSWLTSGCSANVSPFLCALLRSSRYKVLA